MGQQRNGRTVGNGGGMREMSREDAILVGVIIGGMLTVVILLPVLEWFSC